MIEMIHFKWDNGKYMQLLEMKKTMQILDKKYWLVKYCT